MEAVTYILPPNLPHWMKHAPTVWNKRFIPLFVLYLLPWSHVFLTASCSENIIKVGTIIVYLLNISQIPSKHCEKKNWGPGATHLYPLWPGNRIKNGIFWIAVSHPIHSVFSCGKSLLLKVGVDLNSHLALPRIPSRAICTNLKAGKILIQLQHLGHLQISKEMFQDFAKENCTIYKGVFTNTRSANSWALNDILAVHKWTFECQPISSGLNMMRKLLKGVLALRWK